MSSRRVAISMPLFLLDAGRAYLVSAQIGPPLRGNGGSPRSNQPFTKLGTNLAA